MVAIIVSVKEIHQKKLSTYFSILKSKSFLGLFLLAVVGAGLGYATLVLQSERLDPRSRAASSIPNCWPTEPLAGALVGQPAANWCYTDFSDGPSTAIKGNNTWVDEFNHGLSFGKFDMTSYTDFPIIGSLYKTQLWRHANHWMRDVAGSDQGGEGSGGWNFGASAIRPNATFKAENNQLTIEAEVATRVEAYGPNLFWPEIVITTADHPTNIRSNGTYVYEAFPNHWTLGCRLQNDGGFTCAMLDGSDGGDSTARVFELSHFQCGNSPGAPYSTNYQCHSIYGGLPSNLPADIAQYSRDCAAADPDTNCRDRWRWEITPNRLTWYANGVKYMEHTNFDAGARTAISNLINQPVYVYFGEFLYKLDRPARIHWDRIAINPKDSSGNIVPPSAVPGFCLPWPSCLGGSTNPTPTPIPQVPTPTNTPAVQPTPTNTPAVQPTPTPTSPATPTPQPDTGSDALGSAHIGSGVDGNNSNYINGSRFSLGSQNRSVSSMSVFVSTVDSAPNNQFQVAIYGDDNGRPGALVAKSGTGTLKANSWNTLPVSANLSANNAYWLVYNTNGRSVSVNNMRYDNSSYGSQVYSSQGVAFNTWPAIFPSSTLGSFKFSIFATLGGTASHMMGDGLLVTYYDNMDLTGNFVPRIDKTINFNWGNGSPVSGIQANTFSARWAGFLVPTKSELYTFYARSDDGVRVWVNDQLIIDNWRNQSAREVSGTINLSANQAYPIRVEYFENSGKAVMQLRYSTPTLTKQIVPQSVLHTHPPTH